MYIGSSTKLPLSFFVCLFVPLLLQVTLDDGRIRSRRAELKVVTPEAFILAEEEYHIDRGSSLSLVCIIEKATTPPQSVPADESTFPMSRCCWHQWRVVCKS